MYAAGNRIDNLISTIDYNKQQIDGSTNDVLPLGDVGAKLEAFGWIVINVEKGNDVAAILAGFEEAQAASRNEKPVAILLHTIMGNGVDFMMHTHEWHGKAPNDEQLAIGLAQNEETLGDY